LGLAFSKIFLDDRNIALCCIWKCMFYLSKCWIKPNIITQI
jgi:hypothetical protein